MYITLSMNKSYGQWTHFKVKLHFLSQRSMLNLSVFPLHSGIPDAPARCDLGNVTANEVQILCIPAFDGGDAVSILVIEVFIIIA